MSFWEKLTQLALLGTNKQGVDLNDAPASIQKLADILAKDEANKLLQVASLSLSYEKAGTEVMTWAEGRVEEVCKPENLPYCSEKAAAVLGDLLNEKRDYLVYFWLYKCQEKHQVIYPQLLPAILQFGKMQIEYRALIMKAIGNRGKWLANQNAAWHYLIPVGIEEDWEHGNMEERKRALKSMRKIDPKKAVEKLGAVWAEESAAQRLEYLLILEEGLSLQDEEFLKSKLHDRSGKIKTEALRLLRCIPDSEASLQVWETVSVHFTIHQKRKRVGEENHLEVVFQNGKEAQLISEEQTDQEKDKNEQVFQEMMSLIKMIPPHHWETHFKLPIVEIIVAFGNTSKIRKLLTAIIDATIYYKDKSWAKALLDHEATQDARLLSILPYPEREKYALHLLKNEADEVVENMINAAYKEWSLIFSQKLMEVAITDVYSFNKEFFKRIIPFLHFDINKDLLDYTFPDDYRKGYWKGTATEISYLLGLREEIKQVFA